MKALRVALAVLWLAHQSVAATYYVDNTGGNDANDGLSVGNAWETIQKGLSTIVAGDTLYVRAGTYSENSSLGSMGLDDGDGANVGYRPHNSGTSTDTIVVRGYPGDARPELVGNSTRMAASVNALNYIKFSNLDFNGGRLGIFAHCNRSIWIDSCTIRNMGAGRSGGSNCGGVFWYFADSGSCVGTRVTHCTIQDNNLATGGGSNESGIHMYGCDSCEFAYNEISGSEIGIRLKGQIPGAGLDCGGANKTKIFTVRIHHNWFHDLSGGSQDGIGVSSWSQGSSQDVIIDHNIFDGDMGIAIAVSQDIVTAGYANTNDLISATVHNNTINMAGFHQHGFTSRETGIAIFTADTSRTGPTAFQLATGIFNNLIVGCDSAGLSRAFVMLNNKCSDDYTCRGSGRPNPILISHNMMYGLMNPSTASIIRWFQPNVCETQREVTLSSWNANAATWKCPDCVTQMTWDDPEFIVGSPTYSIGPTSPAATGGMGGTFLLEYADGTDVHTIDPVPTYIGAYNPAVEEPPVLPTPVNVKRKGP